MTGLGRLFECCRKFSIENGMAERAREGAVVALSGGADSVFLLCFAQEFSVQYSFPIHAFHVNHGIRGEEGDRDEKFCKELCLKMQIPFSSVRINVPKVAEEQKIGIEECARKMRYDALEQIRLKLGYSAILTAHNATDRAETVLFNLLRGSGGKGLRGIPAVRGNVLRPLLSITGEEIRSALQQAGIAYVKDSTNADSSYSRNYLRNEIFPRLQKLNPSPEKAICRAADHLAADEAYFAEKVFELRERAVDGKEISHADWFSIDEFPEIPRHGSIARTLIDTFCAENCPGA